MNRLWLLFAQSVTVVLAAYFVVATLKPQWLAGEGRSGAAPVTLIQAPASTSASPGIPGGSFRFAAQKASSAVVSISTTKAAIRDPRSSDPWFRFFFGDQDQEPRAGLGTGVIVSLGDSTARLEPGRRQPRQYPAPDADQARRHVPLLLIFSGVIGGMLSFGLIGIFVGPVVLAVTYTLLQAWVEDGLGKDDGDVQPEASALAEPDQAEPAAG